MASRNFPSVRIMNFQHDCVLIAGKFRAGAGGITVNSRFGSGFTVARSGAGDYLITTDDPYRHCIAAGVGLCLTTPAADYVANCGIPGGGAGAAVTLQIECFDTATSTAADPANANDEITFWMILSNSQLDRAAW